MTDPTDSFAVTPGDTFTDGERMITVEETTTNHETHHQPIITVSGYRAQSYNAVDEAIPLLAQHADSFYKEDFEGYDTLLVRPAAQPITTTDYAPEAIEALLHDDEWTLLGPGSELIHCAVYSVADPDRSITDSDGAPGDLATDL